MAESEVRCFKKFCLEYYNYNRCSNKKDCQYRHRPQHEIEAVGFVKGEDFILGQLIEMKNQKPCYFFQLGKCKYQDKCRFLHDNDNDNNHLNLSVREMGLRTTENNPSTSSRRETDHFKDVPNSDSDNASTNIMQNDIYSMQNCVEAACSLSCLTDEKLDDNGENSKINKNTVLYDDCEEGACASPPLVIVNNRNWADAPEFIPRFKPKSYAEVLNPDNIMDRKADRKLCPYASREGICLSLSTCNNLHGELCDMCERFVLHPYNEVERKRHRQECLKAHEKNMELSFAIQRSKDKTCGVCFEVIMEKTNNEQRFGILPNCNHCFCLCCIRKWRQARQFENKIIRACPECRVTSDFVCPSMYWVDTKEEKEKLINDYKKALANKACKYFKKGLGKCPFGNKCFYMHADSEGRSVDVGPPPRQRRHRYGDAEMDVLQVLLWDFLDDRDFPWQSMADDLEDLVSFFTESDESDWSDYDIFFD
ncbi:hypothetical protein GWI33_002801 [Rhynchophorus ferrugineus]|uniref:RING-type E3 ubiquitin transferase n=1 Tax=Rhynchophorus ferrugineus TaxID=354439 RepID=A0A834IXF2_RHYFE|nr:hypothetical protein GWI33_002801 [Rhynchophorus ferrugineus]